MSVDREFIEYVRRVVIDWYRVYGDRDLPWRKTSDPWSVLVATILLRVTARSRVVRAYSDLLAKYPNPSSLAYARIGDVEELIKPIGLHRVRAKQLVELAKALIEKYNGQIPCSRSELIKLPGIGDYTASVILLRVSDLLPALKGRGFPLGGSLVPRIYSGLHLSSAGQSGWSEIPPYSVFA
jgi:A/G-specific adenine glycosylase